MRRLIFTLCLLAVPALVQAQSITSYTFRVFNQGAAQPIQAPTVFQAANVTCNQPASTVSGTVANPTQVNWVDPVNAGKACVWTDPGTGVLFSLPFGAQVYEATLAATNSAATSPESARSNLFTHPGAAPPVPSGVKLAP